MQANELTGKRATVLIPAMGELFFSTEQMADALESAMDAQRRISIDADAFSLVVEWREKIAEFRRQNGK